MKKLLIQAFILVICILIIIIFSLFGCTGVEKVVEETQIKVVEEISVKDTVEEAKEAKQAETPIPRVLLPVRGLYIAFERRGWGSGYYSGDVISNFNNYDEIVGHTVAEEVSLQLDIIKQMGVNTITFELRSADPTNTDLFEYPSCNINAVLGLQYPQPTTVEIDNLKAFFDLVQSKGIKIFLRLVNTHTEEQPPNNNTLWLGTILNAIKEHPALDLVLFDGCSHYIDTDGDGVNDSCGIPAEPSLWMGPTNSDAKYVKWAIGYAHSLGLPYQKLSAEAIVGDYFAIQQGPSGPAATDQHLWNPIFILKGIFDDLSIPNDQRTYAISFGQHRKCTTARQLPCVDANPHAWAIETITNVFDTIGRDTGARVVATEMSLLPSEDKTWNTEMALESMIWIMQNYGIDGGCFYQWVSFRNWDDIDPAFQQPIKQRGIEFIYNPVKDILENLYTLGQTDGLNLTLDSIPPVFLSILTTPVIVKNGDTLEISADLGETHLFVTVEMSYLDTDKTDFVVLIDQGDGTYKRKVTISPWNEAVNGTKSLQINAMDFWSNVTSTTINVELKNTQDMMIGLPHDDFSGIVINEKKWNPASVGDGMVMQEDRLVVKTSDTQEYSSAGVQAVWDFTGDFDTQVDYQIGEGWSRPEVEHLDGANFGVIIGGQSYHIVRLRRNNGDDVMMVWSSTGTLIGETSASNLDGQFRIIRTGTTLIFLYNIDEGWIEIASTTVSLNPAKVYMGNGSINASHTFTTYFDNFYINSGITTYKS